MNIANQHGYNGISERPTSKVVVVEAGATKCEVVATQRTASVPKSKTTQEPKKVLNKSTTRTGGKDAGGFTAALRKFLGKK